MKNLKNLIGLDLTKAYQMGGVMQEDEKKKLLPFFAYLYSKQLNPEKYGEAKSMEEWTSLIQESEEDINAITKAATELTDEDWTSLAQHYETFQTENQAQYAAKGAKLQKLKNGTTKPEEVKATTKPIVQAKAGTKAKKRKCSCGCDLVLSKGDGGKLTETCACKCGGKMKKKK